MDETVETSGGSGGFTAGRADTALVERAIRERWPIPDNLRSALPGVLGRIIASPDTSDRNKISAARAVLAADSLNLEQEKRDAGGETVNHTLVVMTDEEKRQRAIDLITRGHQRRLALPDAGGANGAVEPGPNGPNP